MILKEGFLLAGTATAPLYNVLLQHLKVFLSITVITMILLQTVYCALLISLYFRSGLYWLRHFLKKLRWLHFLLTVAIHRLVSIACGGSWAAFQIILSFFLIWSGWVVDGSYCSVVCCLDLGVLFEVLLVAATVLAEIGWCGMLGELVGIFYRFS